MVNNEDDGGVSLLFFMCSLTIIVILSCITFVSYGIKSRQEEMQDYYAAPLTQEQIDEAWRKFSERQERRKTIRLEAEKRERDKQISD